MSIQDSTQAAAGTIGNLANALKSGVADTSAALSNGFGKAEGVAENAARSAKANVVGAVKGASNRIDAVTATSKADAIAVTKTATDAATFGVSALLRGIDTILSGRSKHLKESVTDHPIRSILIAASVGYLAALLAGPSKH